MRQRMLLITLTLLTAALAGCVGVGDGGADAADTASTDDSPQASQDGANQSAANDSGGSLEDAGPELNVTVINGTVYEGGSAPGGFRYCNGATGPCDTDFDFDVENETTAIVAELAWNASANMELELNVPFEHCERGPAGIFITSCPEGGEETGSSPLRVEITDPQTLEYTGEWDGDIWVTETTPTTVEYTLYLTLVTDGDLPRGYSNVQR